MWLINLCHVRKASARNEFSYLWRINGETYCICGKLILRRILSAENRSQRIDRSPKPPPLPLFILTPISSPIIKCAFSWSSTNEHGSFETLLKLSSIPRSSSAFSSHSHITSISTSVLTYIFVCTRNVGKYSFNTDNIASKIRNYEPINHRFYNYPRQSRTESREIWWGFRISKL